MENMEVEMPKGIDFNPAGLGGVYSRKVHLSEDSTALNDLVIIKIIEQDSNKQKVGDIFLPDSTITNVELLKGEIISLGPEAARANIQKGDIVLYDKWSTFYKPPTTPGTFVITKIENVISKVKKEN